ncbi:uncharacterized protein RCC_11031 [Ramularia collo-cygni]|uniref:Uncharacterized protein n=1 Tax=Ramularia collo-cygni TaxID=112498 RepID=A0A2D3VB49_9PEZI|nr:uncharacterized protein RCC_11031 [Ramularia collo-cygni]CZT25303.1 uncharacterized protein RCC_11031 [Ramularia collo-cygni]
MPAGRHNNRGRIGKASSRDAANGISIRGASSRRATSGRGRQASGPKAQIRELLPDLIKGRVPSPHNGDPETSAPVKPTQDARPHSAQKAHTEAIIKEPPPKVERVYNGIWESGPASFAFATHGNLDHSEDTIILALNILDHIIRPENWNPELSNNKLSASCFFFASRLTDKKVTATEVAESIWVHPDMVAEMSQTKEGPLYDRMLESLTVNAAQIVQGYGILYEQREGLKDLLGEYSNDVTDLPSPAAEQQLLESQSEELPISQVAAEMMKLGYQRGSGMGADVQDIAEIDEEKDVEVVVPGDIAEAEQVELEGGDFEIDFEDFVAENE